MPRCPSAQLLCPPGAWAPPKSACDSPDADPQPAVVLTASHSARASHLPLLFEALSQQQEVSAGDGCSSHSPRGPGQSPQTAVSVQTVSHCKHLLTALSGREPGR